MYQDYFDEADSALRNPYDPEPPAARRRTGRPAWAALTVVGGLTVGLAAAPPAQDHPLGGITAAPDASLPD